MKKEGQKILHDVNDESFVLVLLKCDPTVTLSTAMWSSKLQHINSEPAESAPGGSDQEEWSDNFPPGHPHPIPVLEDGTLELDLGMHDRIERETPVPLQSRAFSQAPNTIQRVDDSCRMKTVNMYVNQHGQKVKLAHLAPAPPSYSNLTGLL